jgi:transcriptional regulator with XRE-family HTH domain
MFLVPRMKERRKLVALTQPGLAAFVNVSAKTVGRWESGERKPDTDEVAKLAAALNTSVAYLLGETDDPAPPHAANKPCLLEVVENVSNNNNGDSTTNISQQHIVAPNVVTQQAAPQQSNIVITVGDVRMEFPKDTSGEVIKSAIEGAKSGERE